MERVFPLNVELIGQFLAVKWNIGDESVLKADLLRKNSPSAEQSGEQDIFGRTLGGTNQQNFPGIELLSFEKIGNYAVKLNFSDGHNSGIYSWEYLRKLSFPEGR